MRRDKEHMNYSVHCQTSVNFPVAATRNMHLGKIKFFFFYRLTAGFCIILLFHAIRSRLQRYFYFLLLLITGQFNLLE